jgi:hypothetical protein
MPQYTFSATPEVMEEVSEIAARENQSVSKMVLLLLKSAIKERKRSREKYAKKSNPEPNTNDLG